MKKVLLIFSGLTVLGVGAYVYYSKQVKLLSEMQTDIQGIQITKVVGNDVTMTVKIKFTSTSDIEVSVKALYLDLYLDGIYAGNTNVTQAFVVPAKGYNYATFTINLNMNVVVSNIIDLITSGNLNKKYSLVAHGNVSIKSGFISAKIPVDFTYPFTIQDLITKK